MNKKRNVALLLLTHDNIGSSLLESVTSMLGICPIAAKVISVKRHGNPEQIYRDAERSCYDLEINYDVLILTDILGSTPSNVAQRLCENNPQRRIITGLNLAMLVRLMNYPQLSSKQLAKKAVSGAKKSIVLIENKIE